MLRCCASECESIHIIMCCWTLAHLLRSGLVYQFVVFANFTCATYLSVFEAPCFSHADIYIGHWNCCHTSLLFFLRFGGSQLLFHLARRQIKRAGLSRYTSLSDLHQKNDGRTCFGARGVVTSSRAGAPSRRGWGGFVPKEGPDSRMCAQGAR